MSIKIIFQDIKFHSSFKFRKKLQNPTYLIIKYLNTRNISIFRYRKTPIRVYPIFSQSNKILRTWLINISRINYKRKLLSPQI